MQVKHGMRIDNAKQTDEFHTAKKKIERGFGKWSHMENKEEISIKSRRSSLVKVQQGFYAGVELETTLKVDEERIFNQMKKLSPRFKELRALMRLEKIFR
ncbi:hypothetical protein CRE_21512 [Caenorhabditis remanei]|uniref:Uncharacterized protein n=1 Tax=Caenorhabditis remanei TaxID=31234 RepID=E3N8Y8_CAERE|nr:hypothetical protein CRE_21512 [Caenorhabditis remanei]